MSKINFKNIGTVVAVLLVVVAFTFFSNRVYFIHLLIAALILFVWIRTKGRWEKRINVDKDGRLRKSKTFNVYYILFIVHSLFNFYILVERPNYTADKLEFSSLSFLGGLEIISFMLISLVFIYMFIKWKSPKQILSIPLLVFVDFAIPSLIPANMFNILLHSYILVLIPIFQIMWALYVRFIFLRKNS